MLPPGNKPVEMTVDPNTTPRHGAGFAGQSGAVRFTRRWFVAGAAALAAAAAGLIEALRRGGMSVKGVATASETMFGSFPVRSVEGQPPTADPEDWVVTVDGLVETPLTIDHAQRAIRSTRRSADGDGPAAR